MRVPAARTFRVVVHHDAFDDAVLEVGAEQLDRGEVLDVVLAVGRFVERVSVEGAPREQALAPQSPQNPYRVPLSAGTISQVLTASQIQALKPVSVFDLLNNTTGAFSTSSGKKGFSGARIRGDSNLVWIVDGAYLPSQVAGRILPALPVNAIEQMEVIRGSSSLTLAPMVGFSNPSGSPTDGFIVIRTRRAQRSNGSVRLAFESNQTPAANVLAGTTFGTPRATGARSLGYVSATASVFDTAGPGGRLSNGHAYNVARHSTSALLKAGVSQGFFNVDATWFHDHSRFQVPNSALVASAGAADNWEMRPSRTDMLVAAGNLVWSRRQTTLFAVSHNRSHQKLNGAGSLANLNFEDGGLLNENRTTHINVRHVADLSGFRLSTGGDVMRWHTPTGQNSYEGIERRERITGLFAQVERSLLRNRVAMDGSVRRDQVRILNGVDYFTGGAQPPQPLPLVTNRTLAPAVFFTAGAHAQISQRLSLLGRVPQPSVRQQHQRGSRRRARTRDPDQVGSGRRESARCHGDRHGDRVPPWRSEREEHLWLHIYAQQRRARCVLDGGRPDDGCGRAGDQPATVLHAVGHHPGRARVRDRGRVARPGALPRRIHANDHARGLGQPGPTHHASKRP
ncbi:MAG: TonB-dependent receptor plug domain-containing protein [Vicinamibacterales bacterium]